MINYLPDRDNKGNIVNWVKIREEDCDISKQTGGHYQSQSFEVVCDASSGWKEEDFSFPIPIGLLSCEFIVKSENEGDEIKVCVAPDTVTGTITADVSSGNEIEVSQTVIDNVEVGYCLKLSDGTNTDDLGRVVSIDDDDPIITVENEVTSSFAAATPTYVKQTICMMLPIRLSGVGRIDLGSTKIGVSFIPANTPIRLSYNNITATAKTFSVIVEYLY